MLYLVRHAKAGSRREWGDDDRERPLDDAGRAQADALAARLRGLVTGDVVSSPYLRCIQTLEPLAALLATAVRSDDRLAEDTGFGPTLELLEESPDGTVLCSHGDVIPEVVQALERRGCTIVGQPDWRKATVWVLRRDQFGQWVEATVLPPPSE